jgi:hypothetical protein
MTLFNPYNNVNLWIKHTFLSFAQGFFSLDDRFTWVLDPRQTKIIIADKFAVDLGVIEKRPAIILSRGGFGWTDSIRGQDGVNSVLSNKRVETLFPSPSGDRDGEFIFTDFLRGSITYNVLSKNGIEAEEIANRLFIALSGYKKSLRKYGIHKTSNISIGDERIVKTTSEIEAMGITVSLGFMAQRSLSAALKLNNIEIVQQIPKVTTTGTVPFDIKLTENIDYRVINNGTQIQFVNPPAVDTISLTATFVDAITLNTVVSSLVGDIDGVNRVFTLSGGTVHGYYTLNTEMLASGIYSVSGLVDYIYEPTASGLINTGEIAEPDNFGISIP